MPIFLRKFWILFKKNWEYIVVVLGAILAYTFLQKQKVSLLEQLQAVRESYEGELKKIEAARKEERDKNERELKLLKKRLEEIQRQYEEAKKELDKKKLAEIEGIMKKHADDPVTLAQKLSEVTGFQVILPEQT